MLPSNLVRWISAVFFLLFVASILLFFPRARGGRERVVRSSRPLSFVTGPLWGAILFVVFLSLLAEAAVPDSVYGGPLALTLPFDSVLQGLGMALWLAGGALAIGAERELGMYTRPEIEVLADHQLIAAGPYRWIRHPLYTAFLMMSAGVALFLLNALLAVLFLVAYVIARRRALLEEDLLASEGGFGVAYRTYMERTGRFLPRLGGTTRENATDRKVR